MKRMEKKPATALPLWLIIPAALFVALLLAVLLLSGGKKQPQTVPGLVTAEVATVYSEADEASATIYALPHNAVFTVLEQKDGWYYTCLRERGVWGWVKAADTALRDSIKYNGIGNPNNVTGTVLGNVENMLQGGTVPSGSVRLCAGPDNLYGKTGKLTHGIVVQVLSYEDGWFYVTGSGLEGYVPADTLLLDPNPFIIQEETEGEDEQQDEESTTPDDGQQNEEASTPDDSKDEEASAPDDNQQEEETVQPPVALPASSTKVLAAGVISDSAVRLRKGTGTDTDIITEMDKGVPVKVFDWKNGWYKIEHLGKTGYVSDELIKVYPTADSLKGYAIVDTDALNMRAKPTTDGKIVTVVEQDDVLTLQGFQNGWFKVKFDDKTGYVSGDYVKLQLKKPAEPSTSGGTGTSAPSGGIVVEGSGTGAEIAAYAQTFIGVPYVYGGASPKGFDCSGYIKYVFAHFGYSLPHGTNAQYKLGTKVSKSELQPGDLVFFNNGGNPTTHAGIYIGDGKFVHSTEYDYGDRVVDGVQIHPLSNAWYKSIYVGARRIVND